MGSGDLAPALQSEVMRASSTTIPRVAAVLVAVGCALAACGGSDDVAIEEESGSEAGGADEAGGAGSNEEAQQSLDDAGVDLDLDALEETAAGFSTGDGGGTVTIDGAAYGFEADICIAQGTSFVAEGLAAAPDGTPAWVSISYEGDSFDFDSDGEDDTTLDVYVEVGRTEMFGSGGDDQPDWTATKVDSATIVIGEDVTVDFDGDNIAGGGPISDYNGVAVPFGETAPMTFEASCS